MPSCVVPTCKNCTGNSKKSDGITFHLFPADEERLFQWTNIIRKARLDEFWKPSKRSQICSNHFEETYFYLTKSGLKRLKKEAIPNKNMAIDLEMFKTPLEISGSLLPKIDSQPGLPLQSNPDGDVNSDLDSGFDTPRKVKNEDSLQADDRNKIKVFCPNCNAEISHTAKRIQEDQTKFIIAKVYHYFEQEYVELKKSFDCIELTPLSKFRKRTAQATGVSETTVQEILQEEARRNAEVREQPNQSEGHARKRPRQTDSSSDEDSENNESSTFHETATLVVKEEPADEPLESYKTATLVVKEEPADEPLESYNALADPLHLKTEPKTEEDVSSDDELRVQHSTESYKRRKTKQKDEAPPAASAPQTPNAPPTSSVPPTPYAPPTATAPPAAPRRTQLLLLDAGEIKMEQEELDEGFS